MKTIWFRRKRYGWGWYPSGWKGWSVIAVYLIIVGVGSFAFEKEPAKLSVMMVVATLALVAVSYAKGETPRWQWGDGDEKAGFEEAGENK